MSVTPLQASMLLVGGILATLAAAGVLACTTSTLTGTQVFGLISVLAGSTAVAGGLSLTGPQPSGSGIIPHLIVILAILGLTVALATRNVFGNTEVVGVFGFILGGGAIGAGSQIMNTKLQTQLNASQPPPQPVPEFQSFPYIPPGPPGS